MGKVAWYLLATILWVIVFPVTGLIGWAFMLSGPFAIIVTFLDFILNSLGIKVKWVNVTDSRGKKRNKYLIGLGVGIVLTIVGVALWMGTKGLYSWLMALKP